MKKQDFEHTMKSQEEIQDNGEFWWLDNIECKFNNAYDNLIEFVNIVNNILEGNDETLKKALKCLLLMIMICLIIVIVYLENI